MLQAMEEESLLATERQAAQEQALGGLRTEIEAELRESLAKNLRAEVEIELRAASAREAAELRGRLEKELRDEIGQQMRAQHAEEERDLRQKLVHELRPEIEKELRPQIEQRLRPEIEKELRPRIEQKLRPEIEKELRVSAKTPAPRPPVPAAQGGATPVPSTPSSEVKPQPAAVSSATPSESDLPMPKRQVTMPRFPIRPPAPAAPGSAAKPAAPDRAQTPTPAVVKPSATALSKSPGPLATKPPIPAAATATGSTPAPADPKVAAGPNPQTSKEARERAERRARVIVSDLSLYHKALLIKAAQVEDARKELGTLWRDAVLAYERAVPAEIRNTTHFLDDELDRYLAQVRQSQAAAAAPQHG